MRVVIPFLLAVCVLAPPARAQSITSFEPDTSSRAKHGRSPADTIERPVWVGFQVSPVTGVVDGLYAKNRDWDTGGTPWVGLVVAWPLASSHQGWATAGYERWTYALHPQADPFGLLPFISPVTVDQFAGRIGIDGLIGRDRPVSVAIGAGLGFGYGIVHVGSAFGSERTTCAEVIAHTLVYFRLSGVARAAIGASGGPTFQITNSSGAWQHWELELRLENGSHPPRPRAPAR